MKVLVTGATGYLGSFLVQKLVESGVEVVVLKRKNSNLHQLRAVGSKVSSFYDVEAGLEPIFTEHTIDGIIHCATDYGRGKKQPLQTIQANLALPLSLLVEAAKGPTKFFINTDTFLDKDISDYTLSKKQFAEWLLTYSDQMLCINMVLEHFYGPGDNTSKFVSWLIQKFLANEEIQLTPGEQKRDFIYISDVVEAFMVVLKNLNTLQNGYYRFEVGSGKSISIRDFVNMVSALCAPHSANVQFGKLKYRPHEVMDSVVNVQKLLELGWRPEFDLQRGLALTVQEEKLNRKNTSNDRPTR